MCIRLLFVCLHLYLCFCIHTLRSTPLGIDVDQGLGLVYWWSGPTRTGNWTSKLDLKWLVDHLKLCRTTINGFRHASKKLHILIKLLLLERKILCMKKNHLCLILQMLSPVCNRPTTSQRDRKFAIFSMHAVPLKRGTKKIIATFIFFLLFSC